MAIIYARQANQNLRYPPHFYPHIFCRLSFIRFYFSLQNLKVQFNLGFLDSIFNNSVSELAIHLVILLVFRCFIYFHYYIFTDDTILILIATFNWTFFYVCMEASLFSDWITLNTNLKEVCIEMWKIKTHSVKWTAITR